MNLVSAKEFFESNCEKVVPFQQYNFPGVYVICDFSKKFNYYVYVGSSLNIQKRLTNAHHVYDPEIHTVFVLNLSSKPEFRNKVEFDLIEQLKPTMNIVRKTERKFDSGGNRLFLGEIGYPA